MPITLVIVGSPGESPFTPQLLTLNPFWSNESPDFWGGTLDDVLARVAGLRGVHVPAPLPGPAPVPGPATVAAFAFAGHSRFHSDSHSRFPFGSLFCFCSGSHSCFCSGSRYRFCIGFRSRSHSSSGSCSHYRFHFRSIPAPAPPTCAAPAPLLLLLLLLPLLPLPPDCASPGDGWLYWTHSSSMSTLRLVRGQEERKDQTAVKNFIWRVEQEKIEQN